MSPMLPPHDSRSSFASPSSRDVQVELEILRGRTRHKKRPVAAPAFLIGRADDCDLVLGDPQFPELYAYLRQSATGVTLRQIGGGPPLTLNGRPIERATLADGDRIRSGSYEFQLHIRQQKATVPSSAAAASPIESDRVEEHTAVIEVEALLSDIRESLFPAAAQLKLYVDPEADIRAANLRAAGLPSDWSWPQRKIQ